MTESLGPESERMIDLEAYDLDGLRANVSELVDLQQLAVRTFQWTFTGPLAVGLLTWIYFSGRMPTWVLVPFDLIAIVLSLLGSALAAVFIVMRSKVAAATGAASRTFDVLAMAHGDLEQALDGGVEVSVKGLAGQILELAVFPAIEDGIVAVAPPPARFLVRPIVWLPTTVVSKTVMAVVDRLPATTLGHLSEEQLQAGSDEVGALRGAFESLPEDLAEAQLGLERTVAKALNISARPLVIAVIIALLPLLGWLLIGDALA